MIHLCNADAELQHTPNLTPSNNHTMAMMFGLNYSEPELINDGSMWRKQWPGGKTKNRSQLGFAGVFCPFTFFFGFLLNAETFAA